MGLVVLGYLYAPIFIFFFLLSYFLVLKKQGLDFVCFSHMGGEDLAMHLFCFFIRLALGFSHVCHV